MFSDILWAMEPTKTVIEVARRAAGLSQHQLAVWAGTHQSSVSEYESRRKSPTLEVVERLLEAADAELAIKPIIDFDVRQDPEIGQYLVPERLWSVPMPDCFSKIQVLGLLFKSRRPRVWDLSVEAERIDYYEWVIVRGTAELMLDSVDGILLMQVWEHLHLPEVIREAWQPVIDAATASQDTPPRDPAGFSAWLAKEIGVEWRPVRRRKRRQ
jgi:transcriptional regulator with XRE-family HTH domain